jgi:CHAT domain-containing protein
MDRHEWLAKVCTAAVDALPERSRGLLRDAEELATPADPFDTPHLGLAALVVSICLHYENAYSRDRMAHSLAESGLLGTGVEETAIRDDVITPVCEAYRSCKLPLPRWWDVGLHEELIGGWYRRWRLAEVGRERLATELRQRWGYESDELIGTLIDDAAQPYDLALDFFDRPPADGDERELREVVEAVAGTETVEALLAKTDPDPHDQLRELRRFLVRYGLVADALQEAGDQRLYDRLSAPREQAERVMLVMSAYEGSLILAPDADDALLVAAVDAARRMFHLSNTGVNAMADGHGGALEVPDWLLEDVFARGARFRHLTRGPIAYWYAVLEGERIPDELVREDTALAFGLVEDRSEATQIQIVLHYGGEPSYLSFRFSPESLEDMRHLALMTLTQSLRVDFLMVEGDGLFSLVRSGRFPLDDEMLGPLRTAALEGLRATGIADSEGFREALTREALSDDHAVRLLAAELSKSEDLLSHMGPLEGASEDSRREYESARRLLLDAHAQRVAAAHAGTGEPVAKDQVAEAAETYRWAVAGLRNRRSSRTKEERLRALLDGVTDSHRAFMHLNLHGPHLDAAWCLGPADDLACDRIDLSTTAMEPIAQAMLDWRAGETESLDRLLTASGDELGAAILAPLEAASVEELVLSPVSFLHAFPFHLLDVGGGERLGDRVTITYAPTAEVLRRIQAIPASDGPLVAASFHEGDLPMTEVEVRALRHLHPGAMTLRPHEATKAALLAAARGARCLHLACHGQWVLGDYWASGLELAATATEDGFLSVAEIHRDLDCRGCDLVVLSACETGRALAVRQGFENYTGIDGAFLARGARTCVSTLWEVSDLPALLLSVVLHARLASGAAIRSAFDDAVAVLRRGGPAALPAADPVVGILDEVLPDWRSEPGTAHLRHPYDWGAFKLSGVPFP